MPTDLALLAPVRYISKNGIDAVGAPRDRAAVPIGGGCQKFEHGAVTVNIPRIDVNP